MGHILGPKSHVSTAGWLDCYSPWPWGYGIVNVGRFGHISLFLPFWAKLGTAYLHGARELARREGRFL